MSRFTDWMCRWFGLGCPPPPPIDPPHGSRPGLLFGYYGMQPGDAAQIADHVNVAHFGAWGDWVTPQGRTNLIVSIVDLAHEAVQAGITKLIFTLDFCVFEPTNPRQLLPTSIAAAYLEGFKQALATNGLLQYVIGWYPIDEPNIHENGLSAEQIADANQTIRYVMDDGLPLYCIYGYTSGQYPAINSFDVAGFDNYGAPIFSNGMYQDMASQLAASRKTMLVPGGGSPWREDPWVFYNHAQTDLRVSLIMPFKWFDPDGIQSNGMAAEYRKVGRLIKAAEEL